MDLFLGDAEAPFVNELIKRLPLDVFHDDEWLLVLRIYFVHCDDARVIERRRRFRLAHEALSAVWVRDELRRKKLDRDEAVERNVESFVNHSHTASAQFLKQFVMRNGAARHNGPWIVSHFNARTTGMSRIAKIQSGCR
jgi:hypothetical protein